ncbi:hypothetical protein ABPG75_002428 [Micractinium tetrahymenae]
MATQVTQPAAAAAAAAGAGAAVPPQPSSPRHYVLPPPADAPQAPEQLVSVPETGLVDVMLCSHRQALTLFNQAVKTVAQGNTHAMELLAGCLAVDIRLHAQAMADVLCPLLERRYGPGGAAAAATLRAQLEGIERDALEMLTFRRERDWLALAQRVDIMHKDYAAHMHGVEVKVLPRLAADLTPEELVSSALLFQQHKQTASLVPQTGSEAFAAAARAGPEAATVLGAPLVAGSCQVHTHAHAHGGPEQRQQQQQQVAKAAPRPADVPMEQEP